MSAASRDEGLYVLEAETTVPSPLTQRAERRFGSVLRRQGCNASQYGWAQGFA